MNWQLSIEIKLLNSKKSNKKSINYSLRKTKLKMIDIDFIEFYISKKYNQNVDEYFDVSRPVLSVWRKKGLPAQRLKEFLEKEKSVDVHILFERIYKREN